MSLYLIKVLYKNDLYKYTVNKGLQVTFINLNLLYKEKLNGSTGTNNADIVCITNNTDTYQQPLQ